MGIRAPNKSLVRLELLARSVGHAQAIEALADASQADNDAHGLRLSFDDSHAHETSLHHRAGQYGEIGSNSADLDAIWFTDLQKFWIDVEQRVVFIQFRRNDVIEADLRRLVDEQGGKPRRRPARGNDCRAFFGGAGLRMLCP